MRYGIESVEGWNGKEFFGFKESNNKRKYVCQAFSEEMCNQMLERIISEGKDNN